MIHRSHPIVLLGLLFMHAAQSQVADGAGRKPNVIVIMTDDQGSIDANCFGAKDLVTPGIDLLASRGIRFTQFYSAAPVCSPSRAGLLTGRYPWLAGMETNGAAPPSESINNLTQMDVRKTDQPDTPSLFAKQTTMAEMFKAAGYATGHVGKWHLDAGPGSKPLDQGFDYSFGHMGGCIDNYGHIFYWSGFNRHDLWENNQRVRLDGQFFPDLMVKKAARFIEKHKAQPFFLYFAMNLPHYPYQGDAKWIEHYDKAGVPYPRNIYAAFVSTLDARMKELINLIDQHGLTSDTIIIFQSDNGYSTEERAHAGGGSSGPYRGAKFSLFEGGIRLPAVISWPGKLPQGETRDQMIHSCDWLPTLAALCEVKLPEATLNGRSQVEVIKSKDAPSPHASLHWKVGNQWAVRKGPWKLIHQANSANTEPALTKEDRPFFLANLEDDPGERKNLAKDNPKIVEELKALHDGLK